MSNMLRTGAEWLSGQLKSKASELVTYTRGSDSVSGGLYATPGETRFETISVDDGMSSESRVRDFTFEAADLVINSVTVLPAKGDKIVFNAVTYEVLQVPGDKPYRPCDPTGIRLRVHTKEVAD